MPAFLRGNMIFFIYEIMGNELQSRDRRTSASKRAQGLIRTQPTSTSEPVRGSFIPPFIQDKSGLASKAGVLTHVAVEWNPLLHSFCSVSLGSTATGAAGRTPPLPPLPRPPKTRSSSDRSDEHPLVRPTTR